MARRRESEETVLEKDEGGKLRLEDEVYPIVFIVLVLRKLVLSCFSKSDTAIGWAAINKSRSCIDYLKHKPIHGLISGISKSHRDVKFSQVLPIRCEKIKNVSITQKIARFQDLTTLTTHNVSSLYLDVDGVVLRLGMRGQLVGILGVEADQHVSGDCLVDEVGGKVENMDGHGHKIEVTSVIIDHEVVSLITD